MISTRHLNVVSSSSLFVTDSLKHYFENNSETVGNIEIDFQNQAERNPDLTVKHLQ